MQQTHIYINMFFICICMYIYIYIDMFMSSIFEFDFDTLYRCLPCCWFRSLFYLFSTIQIILAQHSTANNCKSLIKRPNPSDMPIFRLIEQIEPYPFYILLQPFPMWMETCQNWVSPWTGYPQKLKNDSKPEQTIKIWGSFFEQIYIYIHIYI